MRYRLMRYRANLVALAIAAASAAIFAAADPSYASEESAPPRGDRFILDASSLDDSLLAGATEERVPAARARLWDRA